MSQAIQEANGVSLTIEGGGVSLYFTPNAILIVSDSVYNSTAVQDALVAVDIIDADEVEAPPPDVIPHQFNNRFPVAIVSGATATLLKLRFRESLGGFEDSAGNLYTAGSTFITFRVDLIDGNGNYLRWDDMRGEDPGDGSVVLELTNDYHFRNDLSYPSVLGSGGSEYDLTDALTGYFIITEEMGGSQSVREQGVRQIFEKSITSAANAGDVTIATVTGQDCMIESIVVRADTAAQTDLTSIEVVGAVGKVIEFINATDGAKANIDAPGEQVTWVGAAELEATETIIMTLTGTGATPVDLTVIITYYALVTGGYLA